MSVCRNKKEKMNKPQIKFKTYELDEFSFRNPKFTLFTKHCENCENLNIFITCCRQITFRPAHNFKQNIHYSFRSSRIVAKVRKYLRKRHRQHLSKHNSSNIYS